MCYSQTSYSPLPAAYISVTLTVDYGVLRVILRRRAAAFLLRLTLGFS